MSDITVSVTAQPAITVSVTNVGAQGPAGEIDEEALEQAIEDYLTENPPGGGAWGEITGTLSNQTDLQAELDGKSDVGHSHAQSDVSGLSTSLAGKADSSHTHAQGDVTGLTAALAGKSDTGHTHTASQVTDFDTEVSNNTDVAANTAARHTHANSAVLDATTASFTTADETKLDGIATGATANDTDANLKNRANHTGTQTASTISDFTTAADARVVAGITGKADLASPAFTGNPTAPTQATGDSSTKIATTAFVAAAINVAGSANNPHTTQAAARNSALTKNHWRYAGTAGVDDPDNWVDGDEWITV